MKILFLSNLPTPYQIDFLKEVNKRDGVEMRAYFLYATETNRDWSLALDPQEITVSNFVGSFRDYLEFYKYFKKYSPDVVLVGGYSLRLSNLAFLLSRLSSTIFFYWLEKPFPAGCIKTLIKSIYLRIKLPLANGVFAIGREAAEGYRKYTKNVCNLPYSSNLDGFYAVRQLPRKNINFLFSGQLVRRKNVINLVEAFSKIPVGRAHLTIIGSGPLKAEIAKIVDNRSDIDLLGFIEPINLPEIFKANNVFVLPSVHDGWGLVISEAMAAGMPIIGTNTVGAVAEYIKHRENGYICDTDSESIKKAFLYFINNEKTIAKWGEENRVIIAESLADSRNAADYFLNKISQK